MLEVFKLPFNFSGNKKLRELTVVQLMVISTSRMHPWGAKALAPINAKRAIDLRVPALENRDVIKKKPFFVFFHCQNETYD